MSDNKNRYLKLGLFTIIGLVIISSCIYVLGKNKNIFSSTITLYTSFSDIGGLKNGANIHYAGINIGNVEDIYLQNDTTVMVKMNIKQKYSDYLRNNSAATVSNEGLMGDKAIKLIQGSQDNPYIKNNDTLRSYVLINTDNVLQALEEVTYNAAQITNHLASISKSIDEGEGFLGKMISDSTFSEEMTETVSTLQKTGAEVNQTMDDMEGSWFYKLVTKKKKDKK